MRNSIFGTTYSSIHTCTLSETPYFTLNSFWVPAAAAAHSVSFQESQMLLHLEWEESGISSSFRLSLGSLKMIFRSSPTGRYPGFAASVVCYQPVVLDEATCSPDDSETAETTERRKQFVSNPASLSPPPPPPIAYAYALKPNNSPIGRGPKAKG